MTYEEALKESSRVGASKGAGLVFLAQTVKALSYVHAINPKLVYDGAVKKALTANQVEMLYLDLNNNPQKRTFSGIIARIWQHELDHLDGICKVGDEWLRQQREKQISEVLAERSL